MRPSYTYTEKETEPRREKKKGEIKMRVQADVEEHLGGNVADGVPQEGVSGYISSRRLTTTGRGPGLHPRKPQAQQELLLLQPALIGLESEVRS